MLWATFTLSGCGNVSYYLQQTRGHLAMLNAAKPVNELTADPQTPAALKARLELSQRIRTYASEKLALPKNASYTRYADLQRPYVLWNVVATPALSLEAKQWCFLIAGCVTYRGYYDKVAAEAEVAELKATGFDVSLQGVPAYSTLGKLSLLGAWGADPLLNTFINYPEGELARLIFHEISHQVAYASDDSMFNESFATAVEQLGVERYLSDAANEKTRNEYAAFEARRQDFRALLLRAREQLDALYKSNASDSDKQMGKAAAFNALREQYGALKQSNKVHWKNADGSTYSGYDAYFAQPLNNAHLAGLATYNTLVPDFVKLYEREGRSFDKFYARVQGLAALPAAERIQALVKP